MISSMSGALSSPRTSVCCFFFFNDTATTEIYTLSLHDALPIYLQLQRNRVALRVVTSSPHYRPRVQMPLFYRSEEHTSELQSLRHLVCRLLLEKKTIDFFTVTTSRLRVLFVIVVLADHRMVVVH